MKKILLYFGCYDSVGHFLYEPNGWRISARKLLSEMPNFNVGLLEGMDGVFPPPQHIDGYSETDVNPFKIVAWWDRSLDKRPGSNSNLIGFGYNSAEEMIDDAYKLFPKVMARQNRPTPSPIDGN